MCRRKTDQYVGTFDGPEHSSASHLSAESFDSLSIGTASVASHLSEAGASATTAQVRFNTKLNLLVRLVHPSTVHVPLHHCSTSLTKAFNTQPAALFRHAAYTEVWYCTECFAKQA